MQYEWFVARRYLTARRKQAFISVITSISILGITIGVMALVIAIALITGFQQDVQDKILGSTAHIMISEVSGEGIGEYPSLLQKAEQIPEVLQASPVAYGTVLLKGPYKSSGAVLRGLDFGRKETAEHWRRELERGSIPEGEAGPDRVILGWDIAYSIGAVVGDIVTVLASSDRLTPMGVFPKIKRLRVSRIFRTGLYEYDASSALVSLETAQDVFDLDNRVNLIQVRIREIFDAPEIREEIRTLLPPETYASTWMEMNRQLFSALKLEKKLMFFTIALIVLVASLNIIATLILMVMEKTRDIGILMAMGATSKSIRRIFFFQGAMIGLLGTSLGTALGLIWCWLANTFKLIKVPVDIYQIPYVPFRIGVLDLGLIIGVALLISFLSTLFPSYRASKVDPVGALKYE